MRHETPSLPFATIAGDYTEVRNPIGEPGRRGGPCGEHCRHLICQTAKGRAAIRCVYCDKPVGYQRSYTQTFGKYAHVHCRMVRRFKTGVTLRESQLFADLEAKDTAEEFYESAKLAIAAGGFTPFKPDRDSRGRCQLCGRGEQCPHWHIEADALTVRDWTGDDDDTLVEDHVRHFEEEPC